MESLFVLKDNQTTILENCSYDNEAELQQIIAKHPELITLPDVNYQLLLVKREQEILFPEEDTLFSLDHFFIATDGRPVLVEVKRAENSEIRRKVVGQIMDYASHLSTVNLDLIKDRLMEYGFDDILYESVLENIESRRMRLVFAADEIPDALASIIRFMNVVMPNIEVYGVSLKRYTDPETGLKLISRTFVTGGDYADKAPKEKNSFIWTKESISERILNESEGEDKEKKQKLFEQLIEACEENHFDISYGSGQKETVVRFSINNSFIFCFCVYKKGNCTFEFNPSSDAWEGFDLLKELQSLPGINIEGVKQHTVNITADLRILIPENNLSRFMEIMKKSPAYYNVIERNE